MSDMSDRMTDLEWAEHTTEHLRFALQEALDDLAIVNAALAAARSEGAAEILSSLSYPNRSALRESVRENLEQQYANVFGKRCSTDAARRLAECALEAIVDFLRAAAIRALKSDV